MSTQPDFSQICQKLDELLALSESLLKHDTTEMKPLQALMDNREPLINWLSQSSIATLPDQQKQKVQQKIEQIQGLDKQIEARFKTVSESQSMLIRKISVTRQALSSYKFPIVDRSTGLENEG